MHIFTAYCKEQLERVNSSECPTHYECGQQDAWYDSQELLYKKYTCIVAIMEGDDVFFSSDKDLYIAAEGFLRSELKEFLYAIGSEVEDSIAETEWYFYDRYNHKIREGEDVIS